MSRTFLTIVRNNQNVRIFELHGQYHYKCELNIQNVPLYQFENQTNPPFASCFHLELAHSKAKRNKI